MRRIGLTPPPGLINTNLHHCNCWIYLRRERNMNLIFISIHANPHPLLYISWSNTIRQINYKLGKLLYVDNIFRILGVSVDNLGASCHLKDRLLSEYIYMGVCCNLIVFSSINTESMLHTTPLIRTTPVLRIQLILMRIRILDPHWTKMDPDPNPDLDPGYFF